MAGDDRDRLVLAKRARNVGIVMAATMILWMGAQFLGGRLGLAPRYAFLVDLAALAAFVWSLAVTVQIWRRGRDDTH